MADTVFDPIRDVNGGYRLNERVVMALERIAAALEAQNAAAAFLDEALQPGNGNIDPTLEDLDWYRTPEGEFRIRTADGFRDPSLAECALLATTVKSHERRR